MTEMNASESTKLFRVKSGRSTSFDFHYSTHFKEKQDIDCIVYPAEIDLGRGIPNTYQNGTGWLKYDIT